MKWSFLAVCLHVSSPTVIINELQYATSNVPIKAQILC
jgi:hypothetical protein